MYFQESRYDLLESFFVKKFSKSLKRSALNGLVHKQNEAKGGSTGTQYFAIYPIFVYSWI
jgi:hypothetical protein